jgi:tetratricopeptide (TPR) repeat protein
MDPDFRDAHVNMGVLLTNLKKYEEGISYWKTALKLNFENDPKINVDLARALVHLGKTDEAIIHCNRALESDPQDDRAHACIADIYIAKGQTDLALEHLNKSLQFKPDQAGVCNKKAELLYLKNEVLSAIQYWKKALELKPEMVLVRNNLAWVLSTHKDEKIRNTSEALRHAEKACELTEFNAPESLDTLSAALASAGRFEEAIQTATKAEELFVSAGMKKKAEEVRGRLELYKAGKPYRE